MVAVGLLYLFHQPNNVSMERTRAFISVLYSTLQAFIIGKWSIVKTHSSKKCLLIFLA